MVETKDYEGSIGDRLDRLPLSNYHLKFTMMVTGGEWFITFMLIGVGSLIALVGAALKLSTEVATLIIPTSAYAGMFFGTIFFGRLADIYGRRMIYFFNLVVFAIGGILAAISSNYILIAIFLFILGMGMGAEVPLGDTYISEIMTKENRGKKLAMVYTIAITSAPIGALVLLELSNWSAAYGWRVALIGVSIGALLFQIVRWRMKESPRWLESQGRYKEANELVSHIEEEVKKEKKLTALPQVSSKTEISKEKPKATELFSKSLRKNTIMVLIFQYAQSGVFFGFTALVPTILISKGFTIASSIYFTMIIFIGFVIGSIGNAFYIDKVERKYGVVGSIIFAGIFGLLFAVSTSVPELLVFGFMTAFSLWNMSNFFHQYQAEIFPTKLRGTGTGLGQAINAIASATVPLLIVTFILSKGTLAVFLTLWILIAIVVLDIMAFGPKTSKRELEAITNI